LEEDSDATEVAQKYGMKNEGPIPDLENSFLFAHEVSNEVSLAEGFNKETIKEEMETILKGAIEVVTFIPFKKEDILQWMEEIKLHGTPEMVGDPIPQTEISSELQDTKILEFYQNIKELLSPQPKRTIDDVWVVLLTDEADAESLATVRELLSLNI
jgi:hypothetical protein